MSDVTTQEVVDSSWLQMKVSRQRSQLHILSKRVRMQRLLLRELNEQNPELANDIYHTVKDKYSVELDEEFTF